MDADQINAILADDAKLSEVTRDVFNAIDTDSSGKIERSELKQALIDLASAANLAPPSEEHIDSALKKLDSDGSGDLDVDEFKALVRQLLQSLL